MEKETALSDVCCLMNKIRKTKEVVEELRYFFKNSWKECCIGQSDSLKAQQDRTVSERALLSREEQLHCQMASEKDNEIKVSSHQINLRTLIVPLLTHHNPTIRSWLKQMKRGRGEMQRSTRSSKLQRTRSTLN